MGTINTTVLYPNTITKLGSAIDLAGEVSGVLGTTHGGLGEDFSDLPSDKLVYTTSVGTFSSTDVTLLARQALSSNSVSAVQELFEIQPHSIELDAYSELATMGFVARNGIGQIFTRELSADPLDIFVSDSLGLSGNPYFGLATFGTASSYGGANKTLLATTDSKGRVELSSVDCEIPWNQITSIPVVVTSLSSIVKPTSAITLTVSNRFVFCDGTFTVTLPTLSGTFPEYFIKNISNGTILISATPPDLIDGLSAQSIDSQYTSITVKGDGTTNWYIV
jgi:hypothetical protein